MTFIALLRERINCSFLVPSSSFLEKFLNNVLTRNAVRFILSLALMLQTAQPPTTQAAFDDLGAGARAPGMADTYVAVSDDANALYYNPAGLTQLPEAQITTQYGQFIRGLDDGSSLTATYLGYAQPLRKGQRGTFGAGYHYFKASNLLTERTLILSYGWKLKLNPFGSGQWSAGVNLKQLHRQYEPDRFTENALNDAGTGTGESDPLFAKDGYGATSYAADVAALYRFGPSSRYSAGLSFMNVNRPDVSIGKSKDKAPFITKFGLGYRPAWGLLSLEVRRAKRLSGDPDSDVSVGGERKLPLGDLGELTLRGGYAEGARGLRNLSAGLSYQFARAVLDYAFTFPVGNLADSQGNHRLGLSFFIGDRSASPQTSKEADEIDLLSRFRSDSAATHAVFTQLALQKRFSKRQKAALLQLMVKSFPANDPGMDTVFRELDQHIKDDDYALMDWPTLKTFLLRAVPESETLNAEDALETLAKGDAKYALARLALMRQESKADGAVAMGLMAHTQLAARHYRKDDIEGALDELRQIALVLPEDPVVMKAYRELLLRRRPTEPKAAEPEPAPAAKPSEPYSTTSFDKELPDAPPALVAPTPLSGDTGKKSSSELDIQIKTFGTLLGYYITRKADGASVEERRVLLKQIKDLFSRSLIDMSLIDREWESLPKAPDAETKPAPAVQQPRVEKPAVPAPAPVEAAPKPQAPVAEPKPKQPVPAPQKKAPEVRTVKMETVKPAAAEETDPELERAWQFYRRAVDRGITDHERVEMMESLVLRFGEAGARKVNQELERIRKRLE